MLASKMVSSTPMLFSTAATQPQEAFEPAACGWSEVKCVVSIKYTQDIKDKYFVYIRLNKLYS